MKYMKSDVKILLLDVLYLLIEPRIIIQMLVYRFIIVMYCAEIIFSLTLADYQNLEAVLEKT